MGNADHAEMEAARAAATAAVVESDAPKKLIVAGPGTGKTHTFKSALEAVGGGGVALTFIRALVTDLEEELGASNLVNTFHGFCKYLLHSLEVAGITAGFHYYPPLLVVLTRDLQLLGREKLTREELEGAFQRVDSSAGLMADALELGEYYDAVSHNDLVYRVLHHLEADENAVPVYPLIVVDEYQDFNELETRFIRVLETKSQVLIAGDDDQALYTFKHASPDYIRRLARDPAYTRFELPYCSRCTQVIVDAVNSVVGAAVARGNLAGRVDKEFQCYLPVKRADSDAYPQIIHAACSVERKNVRYIGRYVAEQIAAIPEEHIAESRAMGYPTALVIGRDHFVAPVYEHLRNEFQDVRFGRSAQPQIEILDAYRMLARDEDSRLGWRIVIEAQPFDNAAEKLAAVLAARKEPTSVLPGDYREHHVELAQLVSELLDAQELENDRQSCLEARLAMSVDEIKVWLGRTDDEDEQPADSSGAVAGTPAIVCTTLLGAKGLSAQHVFIVGFNNGVFPADPSAITDHEVCCLIVGLSRTRKQCHLVSCRNWGGQWLDRSAFLAWIHAPIEERPVDKHYWTAR